MKMRFRSLHAIPFLALSALALAHVPQDGSYAIKRTPKTGALVKYTSVIEYEVQNKQGTITASISEKVTNVDKDGNYTVEQDQIDASGTYAGNPVPMPAAQPETLTYKPNGQITLIKGDFVAAESYRMETLGTIYDPGKKLNAGDEWSVDLKGDKSLGSVDAHAEYTLVAAEKIGQVDTLKIKGTIKEISGDRPASSEFTEWISKDDGSMVQLDTKWVNAPFPGSSYPVTASVKILRVAS